MVFSDGPVGVRGEAWDERRPSLNLPSPTTLSSSWDPALAWQYGRVLADEARAKGVDVVLAPTVNLQRSPLGGRHFEAFSEDPVLTGEIGAALVTGLQEAGVAACVKHYVANDYETDRFTASTEVSDRALRELYLQAFVAPVVSARAWCVMSAYNAVNGVTMSENPLLRHPLKDEWGFDGVVVSDWMGVRTLASAATAQDLVMPGPDGPWGDALVEAVRRGEIAESVVDDKVRRLLLLAARVGALAGAPEQRPPRLDPADKRELARRVATEGTVMLRNQGVLPLARETLRRVAVIGHNATQARAQGGGSATVLPDRVVDPLMGLRAALTDTEVDHAVGAVVQEGVAALPLSELTTPDGVEHGVRVSFLGADGRLLHREVRRTTDLVWFGGDAPVRETAVLEVAFTWTPSETGTVDTGFAAIGPGTLHVDDRCIAAGTGTLSTRRLGASPLAPPSLTGRLAVVAGSPHRVVARLEITADSLGAAGLLSIRVGVAPDTASGQVQLETAVASAAAADVAVVVVGTSPDVESEGFDRTTLQLPGRQDELVRAVAATGTPTVVVVNAGAPVLLPWRDEVDAILVSWFGGQEMGNALADVLLGEQEPGGRLPMTWPDEETPPVVDVTPIDGRLEYSEEIHVGHRAWLHCGREPAYPFGHGLGYTTWRLDDLAVHAPDDAGDGQVSVTVHNNGSRFGKQVVQVYLSRPESGVERPTRWFAHHAVVRLAPGEERRVTVPLPRQAFRHWASGAWVVEPGVFTVLVGTSVADLPLRANVAIDRMEAT
ncbi:glycoside hydrolase family 3 C-terminal domain-containing protein [Nocardioides coralli]|nr:glycoside hydrolase family 3 C-terminal domain-containing protein [Nocardioides coralli]